MNYHITIPYGKTHIPCTIPYDGLLTSRVDQLKSEKSGLQLVQEAVENPIGSPKLSELAVDQTGDATADVSTGTTAAG